MKGSIPFWSTTRLRPSDREVFQQGRGYDTSDDTRRKVLESERTYSENPSQSTGGHWFDSNSPEVMKIPRPRLADIAQ